MNKKLTKKVEAVNVSNSLPVAVSIITQNVKPESVVAFAKTFLGVPYKYASACTARDFNCSGYISYVFNYFNMAVSRSYVDFINVGANIPLK